MPPLKEIQAKKYISLSQQSVSYVSEDVLNIGVATCLTKILFNQNLIHINLQ